jgi:hypothetical protein
MIQRLALAACLLLASLPARADKLTDLNTAAREAYAKGRAALLAAADPVILVAFDDIVLLRRGERRSANFTPPLYHRLKELAHLPLGIFGALAPAALGATNDEAWRDELARLEVAAQAAQGDVAAIDAPPAIKAAASKLYDASLAFLRARRMANAAPDLSTLAAQASALAPLTLTLATAAANAQVDGLHAVVQGWKRELGAEAWSRLHVVVLGPKTPRVDHLAYQYFVAELGPGSPETRVIYAENIFDQAVAMNLLGVLLIDRQVGAAFFGEAGRMERDLLADAARVRILQLFGKLGAD